MGSRYAVPIGIHTFLCCSEAILNVRLVRVSSMERLSTLRAQASICAHGQIA